MIGTAAQAPEAPPAEDGEGRGKAEMSKSEGSKRRRSSKSAARRKLVSEWDLRWWDPRSGIRSMSTVSGGFPMNFGSMERKFFICFNYFSLLILWWLWWLYWVVGGGGIQESEKEENEKVFEGGR